MKVEEKCTDSVGFTGGALMELCIGCYVHRTVTQPESLFGVSLTLEQMDYAWGNMRAVTCTHRNVYVRRIVVQM